MGLKPKSVGNVVHNPPSVWGATMVHDDDHHHPIFAGRDAEHTGEPYHEMAEMRRDATAVAELWGLGKASLCGILDEAERLDVVWEGASSSDWRRRTFPPGPGGKDWDHDSFVAECRRVRNALTDWALDHYDYGAYMMAGADEGYSSSPRTQDA